MNVIPAPADTVLVHVDHGLIGAVVGFLVAPGSMRAIPVLMTSHVAGDVQEAVVQTGPGLTIVTHLATGKVFESETDWRNWMEQDEEEALKDFVASATVRAEPASDKIVFGDKSNKTQTFFHWPEANAIFVIEGGQRLPNDPRIVKVKRTEYAEMKRNGAAVIDPHDGTIQENGAPDAQTGEPESEDDDNSDVI